MTSQPPKGPEEDFATMFAAAEQAAPRGRRAKVSVGDRVRGKVASIGHEVTVLELEGGGEGTLETLDLRDADGQLTAAVGDVLEARVTKMGDKAGFVWLRRGASRGGDPHASLAEAAASGLPVEGVVTAVNKGGVEVMVGAVRAFCPVSQLELRPVADPAAYVGQRLQFRVTRFEEDRRGPNVVVSRRALLEEDMRARAVETRGKLVPGAVLSGVVTALKDFGAFVDVGGIEGLLPASEIGFQRGTKPSDVLAVGQPVTVQVLRIEKRDDPKRPEQVSFSLKALERDPWDDAAAALRPGAVIKGQVMRAETFGAFVQVAPGVEGLLHVSELGAGKHVRHAREVVKPGDTVEVTVLAIDPEKRRISLGLGAREDAVDDEGRAAAARAAGGSGFGNSFGGSGSSGGMGTFGDLLKGKLTTK
ncbi:MAG TPA: S1 RNA-binding domain-containing protein [Polyangia bacterium]|nr:S1 RNA-binding domain-containing protein [Polyangia bacterium]